MKFAAQRLLLVSFALTFAHAQTNNLQQVQHVIIVVQENRTPDNLFNEDSTLVANGGHVQPNAGNQGLNRCSSSGSTPLQSNTLYTCWDPDHSHAVSGEPSHGAWTTTWDTGKMDGACGETISWYGSTYCGTNNSDKPQCLTNGTNSTSTCPYAYVDNAIWNTSGQPYDRILDPYFQIASQYGFANYMFSTQQGPSFPGHQFIFSGTSAPTAPTDTTDLCYYGATKHWPCYQWFDAENLNNTPAGCVATAGTAGYDIDPDSDTETGAYNSGYPCYTHNSLPTLLDSANPRITWRYYLREGNVNNQGNSNGYTIWNAPAAISNICYPVTGNAPSQQCGGSDYTNNVFSVLPGGANYPSDYAPILTDIQHCNLQQVSWVIPDGNWSDHGGSLYSPGDGGPSWVAAIVNQVGQDQTCESGKGYWSDTVILVVWDDWGGWYDDVPPPDCSTTTGACTGYSGGLNGNGQQYVYGFRVPLLVIGAYTKQTTDGQDGFTGYISGPPSNPNCTDTNYCHDFGSILNFIEYAFGTNGNRLGGTYGISGQQSWPYADYFAMDGPNAGCPPTVCPYSLSDFFTFSESNFHAFQMINGAKYQPKCFHTPNQTGCFPNAYPQDPDGDANESD